MTDGFEQLKRQLSAAEQRLEHERIRPKGRPVSRLLPVLAVVITLSVIAVVVLAVLETTRISSGAGPQKPPDHPTQPTGPNGPGRTLPCDEAIGNQSPPQAMRVVLGGRRAAGQPWCAARATDKPDRCARLRVASVCQVGLVGPLRHAV